MNTYREIPRLGEKKKAFLQAFEEGLEAMDWHCKKHGRTSHSVAGGRGACKLCREGENRRNKARAKERYRIDASYRAAVHKKNADAQAKRAIDEKFAGKCRERSAARAWRVATGGTMHGWHEIERPARQRVYAGVTKGMEVDHGIPKRALDAGRNHVATGLHCFANLNLIDMRSNRSKGTNFSPEFDRRQRPANRGPGGAFDPCPTEGEWQRIRADAITLEELRDQLDREAKAYEAHYHEELKPTFLQRWPNAFPAQTSHQTSHTSPSLLMIQTPQFPETE